MPKKHTIRREAPIRSKKKTQVKAARRKLASAIPGLSSRPSGLLVPSSVAGPVPPSKLRAGLGKAKLEISRLLDDLAGSFGDGYEVGEIELTVSFSAEGKFLGIGTGGAAEVKIHLVPKSD